MHYSPCSPNTKTRAMVILTRVSVDRLKFARQMADSFTLAQQDVGEPGITSCTMPGGPAEESRFVASSYAQTATDSPFGFWLASRR